MPRSVSTFLMFEGKAEEAMNFYVSLFPGSEIKSIERYGADEDGAKDSVKRADFTVAGHPLVCIDSTVRHAFTFTPAVSLFINCESELELDEAYRKLSVDGQLLMPPGNYGFSRKFVWLNDRYGVSWQLNWE